MVSCITAVSIIGVLGLIRAFNEFRKLSALELTAELLVFLRCTP